MHGGLVDPLETAELAEKQASVINGRLARTGIAVSEDDCEQLGFGQSLCPFIQELLSGPILSGPILDGLIPSHRTSPTGVVSSVFRNARPPIPSITLWESVQYLEEESLEIFPFGMMKAHRMIDGLAQSFQNADFATGVNGGSKNNFLK